MQPTLKSETLVEQQWGRYTTEQHAVWGILYERRMERLREVGSRVFLEGAEAIGLEPALIPDLEEVNEKLSALTGWKAVPVSGFIPAAEFFGSIAEKMFPTTVIIRSREQLEYLPEPDTFHDVFGHVPMHADPTFAAFLQKFGKIAVRAETEEWTQRMARLFWFTIEFGLIREDDAVKVYGSGLISSVGDCENALGDKCEKRPFEVESVMDQSFEIDRFQDVLYVVESFDQLFEALELLERQVE